jgi:urease subunit gamma
VRFFDLAESNFVRFDTYQFLQKQCNANTVHHWRVDVYLMPREMERLTIFTAAEIARRRKEKGLKLNVPEAIAYITDALIEGAREDKSVAQLMSEGATLLTAADVLPGVPELVPLIQVEAHFADGTKLISVHNPIRSAGI